jgi:hypothetical protein
VSKSVVVWRFSTGSGFEPGASSAVTNRCATGTGAAVSSSLPPQDASATAVTATRSGMAKRAAIDPTTFVPGGQLHFAFVLRVQDGKSWFMLQRNDARGDPLPWSEPRRAGSRKSESHSRELERSHATCPEPALLDPQVARELGCGDGRLGQLRRLPARRPGAVSRPPDARRSP